MRIVGTQLSLFNQNEKFVWSLVSIISKNIRKWTINGDRGYVTVILRLFSYLSSLLKNIRWIIFEILSSKQQDFFFFLKDNPIYFCQRQKVSTNFLSTSYIAFFLFRHFISRRKCYLITVLSLCFLCFKSKSIFPFFPFFLFNLTLERLKMVTACNFYCIIRNIICLNNSESKSFSICLKY